MERHFVTSPLLRAIAYDKDSRILEIEFHTDEILIYSEISFDLYVAFMSSPSKAEFWQLYIK
ncbi:KTSC domain protein [Leptospira inadai serovar Lyme str. 10]|uniref:KTSC domain protein n=2 Tax=Leptospira inadai serovar Lyme TaxID=293084 RepID=V6HEL4_9LEPT|nr:KTSC domain-containing protein [Leptospira inadai]EQA38831.1 KTSC domain protein [Leptospira inadai serovar Lyme str. 10]PNV74092.1 KTSC domain-containing protein [Leptospira inadai serovar Lyme]